MPKLSRNTADRSERDRELVERYLAGREEDAFRELYRQHTPYLWGLALRLCRGSASEAEEVVQETWVRGARHLAGFAWGSALRTWLAGILVNCWREHCRATRRGVTTAADTGALSAMSSIDADGEDAVDLGRALATLSDDQRSVVLLHDRVGYNHEEIGALLGIPAGTSKSRLFAARRTLRSRLGTSYERNR